MLWDGDATCRVLSCDGRKAYLEPCFIAILAIGVFLDLAGAAIHGLPLARGRIFVGVGDGRPLPILHLGDGGRTSRHGGGRGSNRHEKEEMRRKGCEKKGEAGDKTPA